MRIGVIQASSQTDKNEILYETVVKNVKQHEVINFGCFPNEKEIYSYVDISIEIGLLISSGAIDFVVTGCSSGQGMIIAGAIFLLLLILLAVEAHLDSVLRKIAM